MAKVPPSTAQGWFEGRHLPTQALMPNFLALLDGLGLISADADGEAWHQAITQMRSNAVTESSPWVGLRSYAPGESGVYVGRERAYEAIVDECSRDGARVVVLVGESGTGKSSLLSAGIIGRACAESGPLAHLTPAPIAVADLPGYRPSQSPTLLVVDQFEEAEQLDPDVQADVFDALFTQPANVTSIIALAASAFGFAMSDHRLAQRLASPVLLGPLTTEEYTRIIEEPAKRHGRQVSSELKRMVLHDLHLYGPPAPGSALPLLSSALRRCWAVARGPVLMPSDYLNAGGLWSALDDEAEAVMASFPPDQQDLARRLLLSMVQLDDGNVLRRRVHLDRIGPHMTCVVDAFLAARLFAQSGREVSISHDALLTRWKRLGRWVEEERTTLLMARRIQMAAQLWDEGGRDPEGLLPVEAQLWGSWARSDDTPLLSGVENDFIEASHEMAVAQLQEQRERLQQAQRRQRVAVTAAVVALTMMVVALFLGFRSDGYRSEAEAATRTAQGRQVALIADEVRPLSPNTAAQLAVAALSIDDSVQTRSSVLKSAGAPMPARAVGPVGNTMVAHLPEHDLIVRGDSTGTITIWRGDDLSAEPTAVASGGNQLFALELASVDGRALALVGGQQTAGLWDLTDDPVKLAEFGTDTVTYAAAFQGDQLFFGTLEGAIRRVDITDPDSPAQREPLTIGEPLQVSALAATPEWLLVGGRPDRVEVFTLDGEPREHLEISGSAKSIAASPEGDQILIGSAMSSATLWSAGSSGLSLVDRLDLPEVVHSVAHLGDRLVLAGGFGSINEYDPQFELQASYPERTVVTSLDVVGDQILAGATGGSTTLWDPSRETTVLQAPQDVRLYGITHGGDALLIGSSVGAIMVTRSAEGWSRMQVEPAPSGATYIFNYALSGDGRVLVNQTSNGDLVTLERDGDAYQIVDSRPFGATLADLKLSQTGRFLALGYEGRGGYELFRRGAAGWENHVLVDAWPGGCAFSPDESRFAAMNYDGNGAVVWDLKGTPVEVADFRLEDDVSPIGMSFSPSGDLAIGDNGGALTVFSLAQPGAPKLEHRLRDARSSLSQVDYSSDGKRLLASTREGQLWVWDVDADTVTLDLQLTPGQAAVKGAAWSEGSLVMAVDEGRVVAWPDDPAKAAKDLCSRFGSRLSEDEWSRLVPGVGQADGC